MRAKGSFMSFIGSLLSFEVSSPLTAVADYWSPISKALSSPTTLPGELFSIIKSSAQEYTTNLSYQQVHLPGKEVQRFIRFKKEVNSSLPPAIFLHGIWSSAVQISEPVLMIQKSVPNDVYILNFEEEGFVHIDAERVAKFAAKIIETHKYPNKVILVGHSRGGIVAAYSAENCVAALGVKVEKVVTLASPFNGTLHAALGTPAAKEELYRTPEGEMSPILQKLQRQMMLSPHTLYYHIAVERDFMIVPSGKEAIPLHSREGYYRVDDESEGHSACFRHQNNISQIAQWIQDNGHYPEV